jgi:hypothetical protein
VLPAAEARKLVEQAFAGQWNSGHRLRVMLPPSARRLRPGDVIRVPGSSSRWKIRSTLIKGLAVEVEAERAVGIAPAFLADPGRAIVGPDEPIGRTSVALFDLPAPSDQPAAAPTVWVAASAADDWKPVPVELSMEGQPHRLLSLTSRAVLGSAETLIEARCPGTMDRLSSVLVRLVDARQLLLNADDEQLMAGANLAALGQELFQFGRAEEMGAGLYRLSRLLRGRRGTEWAVTDHRIGEHFCLIGASSMKAVEYPVAVIGSMLSATARGIGDRPPLPTANLQLSGEALRPVPVCHVRLDYLDDALEIRWVRRSQRAWQWIDSIGDPADDFAERYRVEIQGPSAVLMMETTEPLLTVDAGELPAAPGDQMLVSISTVGPAALSRAVTTEWIYGEA